MSNPDKTIKTDDMVHSELERLKREYGVDTFNEVLRRVLNIVPPPDVEELAAYQPEELRDAVEEVVEVIESLNDFDKKVRENQSRTYLEFISPDSNRKITEIEFGEERFSVYYRNQQGEMSQAGRGKSDPIRYSDTGRFSEHKEREDMLESVQEKVSGAYRRWG